jgi:integrase
MARGHIRRKPERGDDAWEVTISAGTDPATGRRRRISKLVRGTRDDAERALTAELGQLDQQAVIDTQGTVAQLLDQWWQMKASSWSPKTAHEYRKLIDSRLVPDLGAVRLCDLTVAQLDHYYGQLARAGRKDGEGGLAPNSVRNVHSVLRKALRQGVKWGWVAHAATDHATLPTKEKEQVDAPTPEDLRRVLELMDGTADKPGKWPTFGVFIRLAATTGMRRGEMCGLRWSDVDLGKREVRVRRSIAELPGECIVKGTKTSKQRRFRIDPLMTAVLQMHRDEVEARAAEAGVELARDAYVFSRDFDGAGYWKPSGVTEKWSRLRKAAGVESRLHDWRHFCATELLAAGVDVVTVAGRLGHSQTSTTLDIYAHVIAARDDDAASIMGQFV